MDGDGKDAGVVYCEMQARENKASSLIEMALRRTVFPPSSGYRYETGGMIGKVTAELPSSLFVPLRFTNEF